MKNTISAVILASAAGSCVASIAVAAEPARVGSADEPIGVAVPANSPAGRFAVKGQVAISSDAGLFISNTSISGRSGSTTTLQLRPAIDYFVMDNFSVGAFIGVDYAHNPGEHTTTFSIGPRVGYNFTLSDKFSVWPKLGFSYSSTDVSIDQASVGTGAGTVQTVSTSSTSSGLALNLYVPFLFHPVGHFFMGFGPALDVDLTGDVKATTIAGRLTIGGWL